MMWRTPLALLFAALGAAVTPSPEDTKSPTPRRFVYVGDADLAPFDYLDSKGRPAGFNVELVQALARDAGVEVDIRLMEWHQARAQFDAGSADLIAMSYSEERATAYLWLARTWTVQQSLLFRPRSKAVPSGLSDLSGEAIAVQERSLAAEMLLALKPPQPAVVTAATQGEAVRLLQDGMVTGVAGGSLVLRVAAARLGMRDLVELPLRAVPYGLVAAKGRATDLSFVPTSLAHLREAGTLEALAEKHLTSPAPPRTWWDYRFWVLAVVGIVLAAAASSWVWNRSLVQRVKARTQDMEKAMARSEALLGSLTANEQRFQTFMSLTSEAIARVELDEPLAVDRPEVEQVDHILRTARIVEANDAWARVLRRESAAEVVGTRLGDHATPRQARKAIERFVQSGYRLVDEEARRTRSSGERQWVSASAIGVVEGASLKGIWVTQQDITRRKEVEEDLRVRGRILEAVAFSSARLLEPGRWTDHVSDVLARLGEAVGVGCAYIFENRVVKDDVLASSLTHEWTESGVPALVGEPLFQQFPWPKDGPVKLLLEQRKTVATRVRDLPEAGQDLLGTVGLKSVLIVPIFVGDTWWGVLGFGDFKHERQWSAAEIEALKTAGVTLGAALLRNQSEGAMHASERKHRDIVNFAPEGIYQARRDGTLIMANLQFARLFGYSRIEDALSLNMAADAYVEPAERERLIVESETVGHATRSEVRLKRRDGSPFWAEVIVHAVKDASGQNLYFEGFIQDISVRKAAEDQLRASEERYRLLFDGNPVPMLVYDIETMAFLAANEAAVVQYGYSREELLDRSLTDLASPSDQDFAPFVAARLSPRPELVRVGIRPQIRKDGASLDVDITSLAVAFAGRKARLLLCRDVTVEAKAEAEREQLRESLRRSETMSAMGSLVAGVAHEVRNPLFSISATVDALESELGDEQEYAELTELLRSQVSRLRQLMRDLLDYGKPPVLRKSRVHPREILKRASRACVGLAREREVRLADEAPEDATMLNIDPGRMEQVFQNLIANAIQHTPRGGSVRAVARRPEAADPLMEFVIEDEGPGIAPDELARLFEPFFSRRKGGTGLGLSVVQRIVEAHGGHVIAANREGGGARFTVRLPVTPEPTVEVVNG